MDTIKINITSGTHTEGFGDEAQTWWWARITCRMAFYIEVSVSHAQSREEAIEMVVENFKKENLPLAEFEETTMEVPNERFTLLN